jgi:GDPmannose 4,6-dehydratase
MLQQDKPGDYVVATGVSNSVFRFVELAIEAADLKGTVEDFVNFDKELIRPAEVDTLIGDASKIKQDLGWEPKVQLKELVKIMVDNDLKLESKGSSH